MRSLLAFLTMLTIPLAAAELKFIEEPVARISHIQFVDAVFHQDAIFAWGSMAFWQKLPHGEGKMIGGHGYSEGGAALDVDGDGRPDQG